MNVNLSVKRVMGKNKCKVVSGHRSDRFNRGGANTEFFTFTKTKSMTKTKTMANTNTNTKTKTKTERIALIVAAPTLGEESDYSPSQNQR